MGTKGWSVDPGNDAKSMEECCLLARSGSLSFLFHKPQDVQPRGKPAHYGLGPPTLIPWSRNVTSNIPSGGHPDGDTFSVEGPSSLMTRKALTSTPTQTPHQGLASHLIVYCTVCVADDKKKSWKIKAARLSCTYSKQQNLSVWFQPSHARY